MATILLIIIYISFIGLGIPDSLLGAAWPAMYEDLNVPVSSAGWLSIIMTALTMISSLVSPRIIKRFSVGRITVISVFLTVVGLGGISISKDLLQICLFSIPLGLGAGAIDAGLNGYVALHYNARQINFLHCFYGVGITVSPYIISLALDKFGSWRTGYRIVSFAQLVIFIITVFSLPLWKRLEGKEQGEKARMKTLSVSQMFKMKNARLAFYIFLISCGFEFICDVWAGSYFNIQRGLDSASAARAVTFYFIGITLGRFLAGLISRFLNGWQICYVGMALVLLGVILVALPLSTVFAIFGVFFIGFGNGPVYPNMVQITPECFGRDISASIISFEMAGCYVGITAIPPIFGFAAKRTSFAIFPYVILAMLAMLFVSTVWLSKLNKTMEN
ncbi:MAG: MFS transporter [Clostridiales bacterium]|nr:MFS transporter [Clostridiales bacterium]